MYPKIYLLSLASFVAAVVVDDDLSRFVLTDVSQFKNPYAMDDKLT